MMSALFMAMILTGTSGLADAQGQPPVPPAPMVVPPPPVRPGIRPGPIPPHRAQVNLNAYFSTDDYPVAAIRARHMGTTGFRLIVSPNGRVSDCLITRSSGSAPLDEATCRILRARGRYLPAHTADGAATIGEDSGRVTWRLPQEADRAGLDMAYRPARLLTPDAGRPRAADYPPGPARIVDGISRLRVAIGRHGRVIGCDVVETSDSPAFDSAACRFYAERARFAPASDATGAQICDVTWVDIFWRRGTMRHPPLPAGPETPAAQAPLPLREQLNSGLCPGWAMARP